MATRARPSTAGAGDRRSRAPSAGPRTDGGPALLAATATAALGLTSPVSAPQRQHRSGVASAGRARRAAPTPAAAALTLTTAPGAKLVTLGRSMALRLGDRHVPSLPARDQGTLARRGSQQEGWRPPVARDLVGVKPWEVRCGGCAILPPSLTPPPPPPNLPPL